MDDLTCGLIAPGFIYKDRLESVALDPFFIFD